MPSTSKPMKKLFQAVEHGADFPKAKAIRASMTAEQIHEFASRREADPKTFVSETHRYNWKQRRGLKRGRA